MNHTCTLTDILREAVKDEKFLDRLRRYPQEAVRKHSLSFDDEVVIVDLFKKLSGEELARRKVEEVFESSRYAFTEMRVMNWLIFMIGIVFVAVAIWLGISGQREVYVLLFGAAGISSLYAQLFRPMKGVRDALSDFLQAHIIFESANHQIGVWYNFEYTQDEEGNAIRRTLSLEEAKEVSKALQEIRESSARLLQEVLEGKSVKVKNQ